MRVTINLRRQRPGCLEEEAVVAAAVLAFLPGNRKGLGKADCSDANRYSTLISLRREDVMIQLSSVALYLYDENSVKPTYSGMSKIILAPVPKWISRPSLLVMIKRGNHRDNVSTNLLTQRRKQR